MNIGLYQSAASLSALERWQDAVAQNISSSQVPGYRERTVNFSAQQSGQFTVGADGSIDSDSGQSASFPTATNGVNFAAGETQPTGRPLDVAIQGPGFFEVQMTDGSKGYTRNGSFSQRSDGTVVNASNFPVMSDSGSAIVLPPGGGNVTINQDGIMMQGTTAISRLGVKTFEDTSTLKPVAGGLFLAPDGTTPTAVQKPNLLQGYMETSNVSPMFEMVNLVQISRAYEANQHVITSADQQSQKMMDALG